MHELLCKKQLITSDRRAAALALLECFAALVAADWKQTPQHNSEERRSQLTI
jgi:hypothetical protein